MQLKTDHTLSSLIHAAKDTFPSLLHTAKDRAWWEWANCWIVHYDGPEYQTRLLQNATCRIQQFLVLVRGFCPFLMVHGCPFTSGTSNGLHHQSLFSCCVCARDGERRRHRGDEDREHKRHKESRHRDRNVNTFFYPHFWYYKKKRTSSAWLVLL